MDKDTKKSRLPLFGKRGFLKKRPPVDKTDKNDNKTEEKKLPSGGDCQGGQAPGKTWRPPEKCPDKGGGGGGGIVKELQAKLFGGSTSPQGRKESNQGARVASPPVTKKLTQFGLVSKAKKATTDSGKEERPSLLKKGVPKSPELKPQKGADQKQEKTSPATIPSPTQAVGNKRTLQPPGFKVQIGITAGNDSAKSDSGQMQRNKSDPKYPKSDLDLHPDQNADSGAAHEGGTDAASPTSRSDYVTICVPPKTVTSQIGKLDSQSKVPEGKPASKPSPKLQKRTLPSPCSFLRRPKVTSSNKSSSSQLNPAQQSVNSKSCTGAKSDTAQMVTPSNLTKLKSSGIPSFWNGSQSSNPGPNVEGSSKLHKSNTPLTATFGGHVKKAGQDIDQCDAVVSDNNEQFKVCSNSSKSQDSLTESSGTGNTHQTKLDIVPKSLNKIPNRLSENQATFGFVAPTRQHPTPSSERPKGSSTDSMSPGQNKLNNKAAQSGSNSDLSLDNSKANVQSNSSDTKVAMADDQRLLSAAGNPNIDPDYVDSRPDHPLGSQDLPSEKHTSRAVTSGVPQVIEMDGEQRLEVCAVRRDQVAEGSSGVPGDTCNQGEPSHGGHTGDTSVHRSPEHLMESRSAKGPTREPGEIDSLPPSLLFFLASLPPFFPHFFSLSILPTSFPSSLLPSLPPFFILSFFPPSLLPFFHPFFPPSLSPFFTPSLLPVLSLSSSLSPFPLSLPAFSLLPFPLFFLPTLLTYFVPSIPSSFLHSFPPSFIHSFFFPFIVLLSFILLYPSSSPSLIH